jgi:hypothetical protein
MGTLAAKLESLLSQSPIPVEDILNQLSEAARNGDPTDFPAMVRLSRMTRLFEETLAIPAVAAMPAWGAIGIAELTAITRSGFYSNDAQQILVSIASGMAASDIRQIAVPDQWFQRCWTTLPAGTIASAKKALAAIVLSAKTDETLFEHLIENELHSRRFRGGRADANKNFLFRLFQARSLSLNQEIIDELNLLISEAPQREETLHRFLRDHSILLDPLATKVHNKPKFGSEYVPDFVIRRLDDEYVIVELEKASDKLFTKKGNIHGDLAEPLRQIRDFQDWVEENAEYARKKLPGIKRPHGLIVIGKNESLGENGRNFLARENIQRRGDVHIQTYDDLLNRANRIYQNLLIE